MGAVAMAGVVETAYLSWNKLMGSAGGLAFCGIDSSSAASGGASSCGSVLNGPYSVIPGTEIPLAVLGLVAYASVAFLALSPTWKSDANNAASTGGGEAAVVDDDGQNRILLTALTTLMGIFSVFLMTLLYGVLHESCAYCVTSAVLSITLAKKENMYQ